MSAGELGPSRLPAGARRSVFDGGCTVASLTFLPGLGQILVLSGAGGDEPGGESWVPPGGDTTSIPGPYPLSASVQYRE